MIGGVGDAELAILLREWVCLSVFVNLSGCACVALSVCVFVCWLRTQGEEG